MNEEEYQFLKKLAYELAYEHPTWQEAALRLREIANNMADVYAGACEELAIWKKRALEAEELNRKFMHEINGPTFMGEPVSALPATLTDEQIERIAHKHGTGALSAHWPEKLAFARDIEHAMLAALCQKVRVCPDSE